MGSKREHLRVNCSSPCILNYDGIGYQVLLDNISLSGALVKVGNEPPDSLYIGATVDLMLCNNTDLCPTKYACKVVRLESSDIGINFQKLII